MTSERQSARTRQSISAALEHYHAGRLTEAEKLYRKALESEPGNADALHLLGLALLQMGRIEPAIRAIEKATRIQPSNPGFSNSLGVACLRAGRPEEAERHLRVALALDAGLVEAHSNLGIVLNELGKLEEAERSLRRAISLKPDYAGAYVNLGGALQKLGRLPEAREICARAVALAPELPEAHNNLGNALRDLELLADAERSYREALARRPGYAAALGSLGFVLRELGRLDEARECYRRALDLNPDDAQTRWALAISCIPAICDTEGEASAGRTAFAKALTDLDGWFDSHQSDRDCEAVGSMQPYYLAYQEEDCLPLLSVYGKLCSRLMSGWAKRHEIGAPAIAESRKPVRVGIVSAHVYLHSVWNAIVRGWLDHLDREQFELQLFHLGSREDSETKWAQSRAQRFEQGPGSLDHWVKRIRSLRPEVLIYPEIGMDALTTKLASLRLARVQAATWGHPQTSGLPTIDYYLSAEALEPADAQAHYTERLLLLPRLGCAYRELPIAPAAIDLAAWGVRSDEPIFICPGAPFKYAPRHDRVLVEIARRLHRCQFVFFTFVKPELSGRLRRRLELAFREAGLDFSRFGIFLPWQDISVFRGLMKAADAMLDTIGFSGFNTAMQAVECNLPMVTRRGRFMRGRLASGILDRQGLQELVASTEEDYIACAVKLALEPDYRQSIRERVGKSRDSLYDDASCIRALEEFLGEITRR